MKKLIITADDYGMCESVNRAIEACVAQKVVLSTNVMTNMANANDAATLKRKYPYLSIGVHYNFTVGQPLSSIDQVRSLVDENGMFLPYKEIRRKCQERTYRFDEIVREMKAQYLRYREICGEPDYWNTHENVHVYPKLYQLFRDESLGYHIMKMRSHQRIFVPAKDGKSDKDLRWMIAEPLKELMLYSWQMKSRRLGVSAPDGIMVRMNEEDKLDVDYLFGHIQWKNHDNVEMAIHPAIDGNCAFFGEITDLRVKEYKLFSSLDTVKAAKKHGIVLVGFDCIGEV